MRKLSIFLVTMLLARVAFAVPYAAEATTAHSLASDAVVPASQISGTIPVGSVPAPTTTTLGGVNSHAAVTHQFLTQIGTNGAITGSQPAYTDLSGTLPVPGVSSLGGVNSFAAVTHEFITQIGTDGSITAAQPSFADVSGNVSDTVISTAKSDGRLIFALSGQYSSDSDALFDIVNDALNGPNMNFKFGERTAPSTAATGYDSCYADSTDHSLKCSYNNSAFLDVPQVIKGTTAAIGGSALTAGQCASGTVTVTGATSAMAVAVSPSASPFATANDGLAISAFVSASNTVTVSVCALTNATPNSVTYNVRVFP